MELLGLGGRVKVQLMLLLIFRQGLVDTGMGPVARPLVRPVAEPVPGFLAQHSSVNWEEKKKNRLYQLFSVD